MTERTAVITGFGAVSSVGLSAPETYNAMLRGERGIRLERDWLEEQVPAVYRPKLRSHLAGLAMDFDLLSHSLYQDVDHGRIDERYISRYYSRSAVLAALATAEALTQAGIVTKKLELDTEPERTAFVIGTGIGGGIEIAGFQSQMEKGVRLPSTGMNKSQPENAAIMLSMFYGAKGPNGAPPAACASGNAGIAEAVRRIKLDEADVIVAGGTEGLSYATIAMFETTGAANTGDDPDVASRPFHAEPGGAVLSEGAGLLVLEEEAHARRRGAKILGIVAGYAETGDAHDPTMLSGEGIVKAMDLSMRRAGISREDLLHLSAHATATPLGDEAEANAIWSAFNPKYGRSVRQITGNVLSTKGFTGHAVGAANGIEAVISTMILNEGKLPMARWLDEARIEMWGFIPPTSRVGQTAVDAVLSNGMGFGGQNSSIVIKRYQE